MKKVILLTCLFFSAFLYAKKPAYTSLNQSLQIPEECRLTLRQKIAQLCMVAAVSNEEKNQKLLENWKNWQPRYNLTKSNIKRLIQEEEIGGIVFFGHNTYPEDQLYLTYEYQQLSPIPLLIAVDAECGLGSCLSAEKSIRYPYNMTMGAINDPQLCYKVAFEVAEQLKVLGVHVNFAPVVDVNTNPKNPVIGRRSFGSDPEMVANLGTAYMKGLQDAGIIACAKHFPGHGDTAVDSHSALPMVLNPKAHLLPFQKLIKSGVMSVMTAHLEVPELEPTPHLPTSLSAAVVTDLLQKQFGFQGLVFTDALGMKGVADAFEPGEVEVRALKAGSDVLVCPIDPKVAIDRIEQAVLNGEISEEEIDRKVAKVLQAKKWAISQAHTTSNDLSRLYVPSAYELKKVCYNKAVTVYKQTAPFNNEQAIFVLEDGEIPQQLRGKTVVLFCTPYKIPDVQDADNIIVAYENTPETQEAVREILEGKRQPEGKLPVQL